MKDTEIRQEIIKRRVQEKLGIKDDQRSKKKS